MKIVKMGISLPEELVKELENLISVLGYRSRSKAIADAIQLFIGAHRWQSMQGEVAGALVILFDHTQGHVEDQVTDIQHEFLEAISATMHIHLSERYCLEIVGVRGEIPKIKELYSRLAKLRGIKSLQVLLIPLLEEK